MRAVVMDVAMLMALLAATAVAGGAALGGVSNPLPTGPEFQVNSYTTQNQQMPDVAMAADGAFVVVWESYGSSGDDTSKFSIQGQRYDASGTPSGGEFQVNGATLNNQKKSAVATGANGAFIVVWESESKDASQLTLQGQRYAADGSPSGGQFQVNDFTAVIHARSAIDTDAEGKFVVVWESTASPGDDNSFDSIQARRFDAAGSPLGSQFQVNSYTSYPQRFADVAAAADGSFVVVWTSYASESDPFFSSVQGQRYDANGSPAGTQFLANSYLPGAQVLPAIAREATGKFAVVWMGRGPDDADFTPSIAGRRFAANGAPAADQFQVNSATSLSQYNPAIATDRDCDFIVVWQRDESAMDFGPFSIQGRRFAAGGTPLGSQFQINSYTTPGQGYPNIAATPDGDFVVVWQGFEQGVSDTDHASILGRRFRVTGDLAGRVFFDQDSDGIQDGAEPGAAGVVVELYDDALALRRTTLTDGDGNYFLKPKEGSWHLRFLAPVGQTFTVRDAGADDTLDSDADPSTGETDTFPVAVDVLDSTIDAGLRNLLLFVDGFESGSPSQWSVVVP